MTTLAILILTLWTPETGTCTPLVHADVEDAPPGTTTGIPVLMYHHVSDPVNGYYGISTGRFRSDLAALDAAGFYLITPEDLENGLMCVPGGRRPVMLTFDDGWEDNLSFTGSDLDPDCVLAILTDYCDEHPEFGDGATFFISWDKVPFGVSEQVGEKLNMILDLNCVVGNHTRRHASFLRLPREDWAASVLGAMDRFQRSLGLRTTQVSTLAYPGGGFPREPGAEELVASFTYDGAQAVRMGFLANGSISSFGTLLESPEGWYRIGRLDMSQYSVPEVLGWRNLMARSQARDDLHDPLPWRMPPVDGERL